MLAAGVLLGGCKIQDDASFRRATADRTSAPTIGGAASSAASAAADAATIEGAIPEGAMGASVRRGRAILLATRDSLPRNAGNGLRCVSCHLDEGRRPFAMPLTGVAARFPQYRARGDRVERLEDKVNDCLRRSLGGTPLAFESAAMRDIVAYLAHLSRGVPHGTAVAGQSVDSIRGAVPGNAARGRTVYAANCVRCHGANGAKGPSGAHGANGANGQGTSLAPPVWGPRSFTVAAGMARWRVLAAFVRHNMPNDRRESLTDQEALDVAAWVLSQRRPDFRGKERDYPRGNAPPDLAYRTRPGK